MVVLQPFQLVNNRCTIAELQVLQTPRVCVALSMQRELIATKLILRHAILLGFGIVNVADSDISPGCVFGSSDKLVSDTLVQARIASPNGFVDFLLPREGSIDLTHIAANLAVARDSCCWPCPVCVIRKEPDVSLMSQSCKPPHRGLVRVFAVCKIERSLRVVIEIEHELDVGNRARRRGNDGLMDHV